MNELNENTNNETAMKRFPSNMNENLHPEDWHLFEVFEGLSFVYP